MDEEPNPNPRNYPTINGVPVVPFQRRSLADVRNSRRLRRIREALINPNPVVGSNAEDVEGGSDLNEDQGESSGTVVENPAAVDVSGSSTEESSGTVVENPAADVSSGTKAEVLGGSVH